MEIMLPDSSSLGCQRFVQQRVKQTAAGVVAGGEARLQPVAKRHQFINLGDDAVLLGEGWEGEWRDCGIFSPQNAASSLPVTKSSDIVDEVGTPQKLEN